MWVDDGKWIHFAKQSEAGSDGSAVRLEMQPTVFIIFVQVVLYTKNHLEPFLCEQVCIACATTFLALPPDSFQELCRNVHRTGKLWQNVRRIILHLCCFGFCF